MKISIKISHVFILIFTLFYSTIFANNFVSPDVEKVMPNYSEKTIDEISTTILRNLSQVKEITSDILNNAIENVVIIYGEDLSDSDRGKRASFDLRKIAVLKELNNRVLKLSNVISEYSNSLGGITYSMSADPRNMNPFISNLWVSVFNKGMIIDKNYLKDRTESLLKKSYGSVPGYYLGFLFLLSEKVSSFKTTLEQLRDKLESEVRKSEKEAGKRLRRAEESKKREPEKRVKQEKKSDVKFLSTDIEEEVNNHPDLKYYMKKQADLALKNLSEKGNTAIMADGLKEAIKRVQFSESMMILNKPISDNLIYLAILRELYNRLERVCKIIKSSIKAGKSRKKPYSFVLNPLEAIEIWKLVLKNNMNIKFNFFVKNIKFDKDFILGELSRICENWKEVFDELRDQLESAVRRSEKAPEKFKKEEEVKKEQKRLEERKQEEKAKEAEKKVEELPLASLSDIPTIFEKISKLKEYGRESYGVGPGFSFKEYVTKDAAENVIVSYKEIERLINDYKNKIENELGNKGLSDKEFYIQKKDLASSNNEYCVVGDIHGSIHSFVKILKDLIKDGYLDNQLKIQKNNFYMVFIGDYVDRGFYGVEVLYLLLRLKLANWEKVIPVRGNHEDINTTLNYGFFGELKAKYKNEYPSHPDCVEQCKKLHKKDSDEYEECLDQKYYGKFKKDFGELFKYLPMAFFIKNGNDWMAFCHGGLDEDYKEDMEELLKHNMPNFKILTYKKFFSKDGMTGFNWFDLVYDSFVKSYSFDASARTQRTIGRQKNLLLDDLGIKILCRGHQHGERGLKGPMLDGGHDLGPDLTIKDKVYISTIKPPIFTFTTATETGLMSWDVFYGMIKTYNDYKDWVLVPHLLDMPVRPEYAKPKTEQGEAKKKADEERSKSLYEQYQRGQEEFIKKQRMQRGSKG